LATFRLEQILQVRICPPVEKLVTASTVALLSGSIRVISDLKWEA
jgi:hypothetical protein